MLRVENLPDHRIAYKVTEYGTIAHDKRSGEVANVYPRARQMTITTLRSMGDITDEMWAAGWRYHQTYMQSGLAPRVKCSDPTRPYVDGSSAAPDELLGNDGAKLYLDRLERDVLGAKGRAMLDLICGQDMTMRDYRFISRKRWQAIRRELREHLKELAAWYERFHQVKK